MKKLIFIFTLLLSNSINAKWIYYFKDSDDTRYWYENNRFKVRSYDGERIKSRGENIFVWVRASYNKMDENSVTSSKYQYKINCDKYSYQSVKIKYYKNNNWTSQISNMTNEINKLNDILPNSPVDKLAKKICKKKVSKKTIFFKPLLIDILFFLGN